MLGFLEFNNAMKYLFFEQGCFSKKGLKQKTPQKLIFDTDSIYSIL